MTITEWAANATRGDTYEYFRGELAKTREEVTMAAQRGRFVPPAARANCDAANDAWRLYETGAVTLLQRRLAPRAFSYIAVRR